MTASLEFSAGCEPRRVDSVAGWRVFEYETVGSTNLVAAGLPVWSAVRADEQTHGRGRFQRSWVSNRGGLWLSAVVPLGAGAAWRALPLLAGLAVCKALRTLGVQHFRMRWPNDLLVNDRKLAGLLVDQFRPECAVVGIGINVHNRPEVCDPGLLDQAATLGDLVDSVALEQLAGEVLRHLRLLVENLVQCQTLDGLLPEINQLWAGPRRVELDLEGSVERGWFNGVDHAGRLGLAGPDGKTAFYDASQVRHLTEIEN